MDSPMPLPGALVGFDCGEDDESFPDELPCFTVLGASKATQEDKKPAAVLGDLDGSCGANAFDSFEEFLPAKLLDSGFPAADTIY
jgi:hypothetical protein